MLKARPSMSEILRILPGSSLVVAPTDRDRRSRLAAGQQPDPSVAAATAAQRPLLQMAWDHVGSALDQRRSV